MESLIKQLNSESESERSYAAEDLGYENRSECIAPLINRLEIERSRNVKEAIMLALSKLESATLIEAMIGLLESEDPYIRNAAVAVMRKKGVVAMPALLVALQHANAEIRKFSFDALAVLEMELIGSIYKRALADDDINVKITAVEYVGRNHKVQFKTTVENILLETNKMMLVSACLQALEAIGDRTSQKVMQSKYPNVSLVPASLQEAWKNLVECLEHRDPLGEQIS